MQRIVYLLTLLILMTLACSLLSRPTPLPTPGSGAYHRAVRMPAVTGGGAWGARLPAVVVGAGHGFKAGAVGHRRGGWP